MKLRDRSILALLLAILELSFLPIMLNFGGSTSGSIKLLFYVFLIATFVSFFVSYTADRRGLISLLHSKNAIVIMVIAGLCNNAVSQLLLAIGTIGTNPSIAGVMFRSWVIVVAVLTPIVLRNRVSKTQLAAMLIGFLGVYVIASNGTLSLDAAFSPYMLVLLGAAFVTAIATMLVKGYNASTTASVAVFNIASFVFISLLAITLNVNLTSGLSQNFLIAAVFLGVITYGIGTTLYYYAFKSLGPLFVGNATLAIPFMTIVLSSVLLGIQIQSYYIYSAVLLAVAIFAQQRLSYSAPEYIEKKGPLQTLQIFDVTSAFIDNSEMNGYIRANNRALAIKLGDDALDSRQKADLLNRYRCVVFTNKEPHRSVATEEIDFINDIMGVNGNETVLIGMGDVRDIESAFRDVTLRH